MQCGKPWYPWVQKLHLSPRMKALQAHFPVSSSQETSLDPSSSQSQAIIF